MKKLLIVATALFSLTCVASADAGQTYDHDYRLVVAGADLSGWDAEVAPTTYVDPMRKFLRPLTPSSYLFCMK